MIERETPPRVAMWLLKLCCSPARHEEVAGDLHELYARRLQGGGIVRARLSYLRDVLEVSARQVGRRLARANKRGMLVGPVHLYPLRVLALAALSTAVLTTLSASDPWIVGVRNVCLVAYPALEILGLAAATRSRRRRGARRARTPST